MKKNKQTDWTDILRDRLQDARLPLDDGWADAGAGVSGPARGGLPLLSRSWPWALAGVAAVLAAVLLLRPAQTLQPAAPSAPLASVSPAQPRDAAPSLLAQELPGTAPAGNSRASLPQTAGRNGAPQAARNEDLGTREDDGNASPKPKNASPVSAPAPREGEKDPSSAGVSPSSAVRADASGSLADAAQDGFPAGPGGEEPSGGGAVRHRPVSLRLQAAGPGVSLGAAGGSYGLPTSMSDFYTSKPDSPQVPNPVESSQVRRAPAFPISVGISAAMPLSRRWSLAAGLEYTRRTGAVPRVAGSTAPAQEVTLHYLGIPLDLHCYLNPDDRLRVWLGGGLKAEKAIHVEGAAPLRDPLLCSWNLQAGTDLRVLPGVRLYLSPALTKYLNQSAYGGGWDDRPQLILRAGLSFDL